MSTPIYLEMSLDSTHERELPHDAYLVLNIFPPFPAEIAPFRLPNEPLFLIEVATYFTNILTWGCILLHYSD